MHTPEDAGARWREVQRLLDGALDLPPDQRTAFLERSCADDATLLEEATRLLRSCERAEQTDDFLTGSAAAFAAPLVAEAATDDAAREAERRAVLASALETASSGRYIVERELGRGGMATVYLARDRRHERRVAVKVLERNVTHAGAHRFLREVRTAAALTHPHIVGVHDSGEADGFLYFVMPFVDGETLQQRVRREGPLPVADALRLLRDVADALAYAHAQGLVHRDLKPANVLLSGGHALVADFGIAKALALAEPEPAHVAIGLHDSIEADLTAAGIVLGTPAYMAPEQLAGGAADARSDVYALGVVIYEALAGEHPFGDRAPHEMLPTQGSAVPSPLETRRSDVPPELAALVVRLLARDPAARPQDAGEVLRILDELRLPAPRLRRSSRRARIAAAAALVIALIVTGAYSTWRFAGGSGASVATPGGVVGTAAAAPTALRRVAVLPFVNTGGEPRDEYFSDGITDELALALARLPGLRVAGRTSSYAFKGRSLAAQEVGDALGVHAIVTGTVRRAGDRLRVTAQLVSTADGSVLWGDAYESRSSDVFAVQDEFTASIVRAIAPSLGQGSVDAPALRLRRGTSDQEAYDLYLRGRYLWLERGAANLDSAIGYFRAAISRDPSFARAHAGLAQAYAVLPLYVPGAESALALQAQSAARAVMLDSTLADAHVALATARELQLRFAEAEAHYRKALALEPDNVTGHHWFGYFLIHTGRVEHAITELSRAAQLDPLAKSAGSASGLALIAARRFPEATAAVRRVLATDSSFSIALLTLGFAHAFGGQPDSAVATLERAVRLYPQMPRLRAELLFAYAAAGRWSDAARVRAQRARIIVAIAAVVSPDMTGSAASLTPAAVTVTVPTPVVYPGDVAVIVAVPVAPSRPAM
jgi:TolB-like protein/tetratricopeptide (TPR) repeat protein/tRNA A-37 threonylcarbamoyl transferase component Bud32